jgi:hypothetical protein
LQKGQAQNLKDARNKRKIDKQKKTTIGAGQNLSIAGHSGNPNMSASMNNTMS